MLSDLETLKISLWNHFEIGDNRLQSAIEDFEIDSDMEQRGFSDLTKDPKTIRSILAKGSNLNLKQVIAAHL